MQMKDLGTRREIWAELRPRHPLLDPHIHRRWRKEGSSPWLLPSISWPALLATNMPVGSTMEVATNQAIA